MANEFQTKEELVKLQDKEYSRLMDPVEEELNNRTDVRKALDDLAAEYGDPSFFGVLLKEVEVMLIEMSDEQSAPESSYAEKVLAMLYSDAAKQVRRAAAREEAARRLYWKPDNGLASTLVGTFNLR